MNRFSLRYLQTAALITTCVLAATLSAQPAAAYPADTTRAAMAAYLHEHPGGTPISDRDIAYGGGTFIVTVTRAQAGHALAAADCPSGWFCFYDGVNYTYPRGRLSSCGWQDLGTWGWRNRTESVHYNMSSGTVGFLNEAGSVDTVLFTAGTTRRTIADVNPYRNQADYVSRTNC
ncbi:peptidase inhibitor family I36 protein [Actinoplanes oblitus]|uniref:Peptidase inhibitor family I36 protein n=1 Tax=Actinoplanes oblitus TaxID=3040509 RepID=A0ABY8WR11_9ACTN|nr:peptidase inhibitor family I36 protein [Actinoplanes oblitus]WIN00089.1 peptidase inhibitor family I36 protein [Actinoplanes oblitus]